MAGWRQYASHSSSIPLCDPHTPVLGLCFLKVARRLCTCQPKEACSTTEGLLRPTCSLGHLLVPGEAHPDLPVCHRCCPCAPIFPGAPVIANFLPVFLMGR